MIGLPADGKTLIVARRALYCLGRRRDLLRIREPAGFKPTLRLGHPALPDQRRRASRAPEDSDRRRSLEAVLTTEHRAGTTEEFR